MFFKNYLTLNISYEQPIQALRQSVETTPLDEVCQLIFRGFIVFL